MKKIVLLLLFFIGLTFALFSLAGASTPPPGASAGNGNPVLLIVFFLVPLGGLLAVLWVALLRRLAVKPFAYVLVAAVLAVHLLLAFWHRQEQLNEYRDVIRQAIASRPGLVDEAYITAITTGLSIHINNQNFNVNTFFMFLSLTLLAACLYRLVDLWEARGPN